MYSKGEIFGKQYTKGFLSNYKFLSKEQIVLKSPFYFLVLFSTLWNILHYILIKVIITELNIISFFLHKKLEVNLLY